MKAKKVVFSIIVFLTLVSQLKSQDYIRLINDSLYWDMAVAEPDYMLCPGWSGISPWRLFFNGDSSTINGKVYYHMYSYQFIGLNSELPTCPPFVVDTIPSIIPTAYIREDVINQKVYKYNFLDDTEYLLFDFSLNQGDTFHSTELSWDFKVDSVYQYLTEDGLSRKVILLGNGHGYMFEGIGGPAGPTLEPFYMMEQGHFLMCVQNQHGFPIVDYLFYDCYYSLSGIDNQISTQNQIKVYPNPFNDIIQIEYNKDIQTVKISNVSGIILKTLKVNSNLISIETKDLKSGMYFIEITTNNQIINRKLLKINSL